jgi:HK97 family phage major capsid protein
MIRYAKNLDSFLTNVLGRVMGLALDQAMLSGTGIGESPQGILYNAAITNTAAATGESAEAWKDISASMGRVEAANYPTTAMIMSPRSNQALRDLRTASDKTFVDAPSWAPPRLITSSIPNTLGAGTSSAVIVGDFRQTMFAIATPLRIRIFEEALAQKGQVAVCATFMADCGVVHASALDVISTVPSNWGTVTE